MSGAKIAVSTQNSTRAAPIMPTGDSRSSAIRLNTPSRKPSCFLPAVMTAIPSPSRSGEADARVQQHVAEIADDLRRHGDEDREHGACLDHGDILVEGGVQHHPPESRISDHRLDHHDAGDE